MSALLSALERLLALSEAMAAAAEAQEWERLFGLGEEHSACAAALPAALAAQLPDSEKAAARTIIERNQGLDQRTHQLVEERQQALRVLLREPVN